LPAAGAWKELDTDNVRIALAQLDRFRSQRRLRNRGDAELDFLCQTLAWFRPHER